MNFFTLLIECKSVKQCLLKLHERRVLSMLLVVEAHVGVSSSLIHKHVIEGSNETMVAILQHVDRFEKTE